MKSAQKFLFLILAVSCFLFNPIFVSAEGTLGEAVKKLAPVGQVAGTDTEGDIQSVIGSLVNASLTLIGTIFFLLMVYAGYLWLTARGDEGQVDKSKQIISTTIIGLVVVISAYAITVFVTGRFQTAPNAGYCSLTMDTVAASTCTQQNVQCNGISQTQCEANPTCCTWVLQ